MAQSWRQRYSLFAVAGVMIATIGTVVVADVSRPGGAGHALQFRDHGVLLAPFNDLGRDAFTFEAWISTSDFCHASALFSYAKVSTSSDPDQQVADANHLVIFDPKQLVACHDFQYIDLWPDPGDVSCYASFNHSDALPSFVERDGRWHHVAVTWTAAENGLTKIYWDGLLRAQTPTGKTSPLELGGALMLGAEQDCYGGCTDRGQGFYGLMDEVRLWRVARSQQEILEHMRDASGLENHEDLAAYWKFNDVEDNGVFRETRVARDSSGRGNDLTLTNVPGSSRQSIRRGDKRLEAGVLTFRNNYAMNQSFTGMPKEDITVEFWARTPAYNTSSSQDKYSEFFSFSSFAPRPGRYGQTMFLDDAILIEKYMKEFSGTHFLHYDKFTTAGSISVHINANREGSALENDHWIDFKTDWIDDEWHHLAVTWAYQTGETRVYLDGEEKPPFWVSQAGSVTVSDPSKGEVDRRMAAHSQRSWDGSLVLGQKQDCYGGCFSPTYSLHGDMANLRVWSRVLSREEIQGNMFVSDPGRKDGLAISYAFDPGNVHTSNTGKGVIYDVYGEHKNDLELGADAPSWVYSTAPLADTSGRPVEGPRPGTAGHAMNLNDQQVLILKDFQGFPEEEVTLEFWMLSTDACRMGTPFSYATGGYGRHDNTFLVFDYNNWGVSVMEDEGHYLDHKSGTSATDGSWHHIAVTWRSSDGETKLYDNGREVWSVIRGKGKKIPSGGTLVVGREQDCEGGCFDSDYGAAGDVQDDWDLEYGAQDFFGLIDEMRLWRRVRTPEQIMVGMRGSLYRRGITGESFDGSSVDPHHPDLVAYWNFDEGSGYVVKDVTGKGHHLLAAEPPKWEVVQWLSVCGNGKLEGLEECDVGDAIDGDGCSSSCKVEPGWECSKTSPSTCWRTGSGGGGDTPPPDTPRPPSDPHSRGDDHDLRPDGRGGDAPPSGGGGGGGVGGGHAGAIVALVLSGVAVVTVGALLVFRHSIYEQLPMVERAVEGVRRRVTRGKGGYDFAGELGLDPVDALEMSPEFTTLRPPPGRGGYTHLPGREAAEPAGPSGQP